MGRYTRVYLTNDCVDSIGTNMDIFMVGSIKRQNKVCLCSNHSRLSSMVDHDPSFSNMDKLLRFILRLSDALVGYFVTNT